MPRGVLEHDYPVHNDDMPHFINRLFHNMQLIREKILHIPDPIFNDHHEYVFPSEFAMMKEPQLKGNLEPKWLGPYSVIDVMYPVIRLNIDGIEKNVNIDMVKPAFILQNHDNELFDDESVTTVENNLAEIEPDSEFDGIILNPASQDPHLFNEIINNPLVHVQVDPITDIVHFNTQ